MNILEELSAVKQEQEVKYTYYYRLTCNGFNITSKGKSLRIKSYGIEVERKDYINNSIENIERSRVLNISPYRNKVTGLLNIIYNNNVSPIHLIDAIGNYIDECACDYEEGKVENIV